jgi:hypothetical protein
MIGMELQLIQNKIFEIRGQRVMMDFDLAEMYCVDTRSLKQAVKRNINRFPPDFMFELSTDEWECLVSQIVIPNRGGNRFLPYAFTEQGVAMLSSVLHSEKASKKFITQRKKELKRETQGLKKFF